MKRQITQRWKKEVEQHVQHEVEEEVEEEVEAAGLWAVRSWKNDMRTVLVPPLQLEQQQQPQETGEQTKKLKRVEKRKRVEENEVEQEVQEEVQEVQQEVEVEPTKKRKRVEENEVEQEVQEEVQEVQQEVEVEPTKKRKRVEENEVEQQHPQLPWRPQVPKELRLHARVEQNNNFTSDKRGIPTSLEKAMIVNLCLKGIPLEEFNEKIAAVIEVYFVTADTVDGKKGHKEIKWLVTERCGLRKTTTQGVQEAGCQVKVVPQAMKGTRESLKLGTKAHEGLSSRVFLELTVKDHKLAWHSEPLYLASTRQLRQSLAESHSSIELKKIEGMCRCNKEIREMLAGISDDTESISRLQEQLRPLAARPLGGAAVPCQQ